MKQKIMYMMALFCCLGFYSSAKQVDKNCTKKCCVVRNTCVKKPPVKTCLPGRQAKKITAAAVRPFNFYLFNI